MKGYEYNEIKYFPQQTHYWEKEAKFYRRLARIFYGMWIATIIGTVWGFSQLRGQPDSVVELVGWAVPVGILASGILLYTAAAALMAKK